MRWLVFTLVTIIAFLLVLCYALLAIASEAEEKDKRMYERWKDERSR